MKRIALAAVLLVALVGPALAGLAEGWAAYKRGDYATALIEWRPLAEQGNADAQFAIGSMYLDGQGVPQDDAEAVMWWRKAAENGQPNAQGRLAWAYASGRGVTPNLSEAVKGLQKSAEQGLDISQHQLGEEYYTGKQVSQDDAEAVMWWRKAAEQGNAEAQRRLGRSYALGRGAPEDFVGQQVQSRATKNPLEPTVPDQVAGRKTEGVLDDAMVEEGRAHFDGYAHLGLMA